MDFSFNMTGILIGIVTILIIGVFHPLVIWGEYYFSKRIWPAFLAAGLVFIFLSLLVKSVVASSIFAVTGASCIWSIRELFEQEKRVARGWFPENKRDGNKEDKD